MRPQALLRRMSHGRQVWREALITAGLAPAGCTDIGEEGLKGVELLGQKFHPLLELLVLLLKFLDLQGMTKGTVSYEPTSYPQY